MKALVLELVEVPTVGNRIAQGPIPLDEALPMAKAEYGKNPYWRQDGIRDDPLHSCATCQIGP